MPSIPFVPTVLVVATLLPTTLSEPKSGPLARELADLMTTRHIDAVAAKDPETPDRFVAAQLFPGVGLFVVAARYSAPRLQEQLGRKEYKDIYDTLQQASSMDGKVFFEDLQADGLHTKPDTSVDILYEGAKTQTIFDGNPSQHKMSEAAYVEKFTASDTLYCGLLSLLIRELTAI